MELQFLVSLTRRWWPFLVAMTVIGALAGSAYADSRQPVYEATVRMLIGPINADSNTLRAAGQTSQTYAELATNKALFRKATENLALPGSEEAVVRAVASDVTRLLQVSVRSEEPQVAASVANAVAFELVELSEEERLLSQAVPVTEPAPSPSTVLTDPSAATVPGGTTTEGTTPGGTTTEVTTAPESPPTTLAIDTLRPTRVGEVRIISRAEPPSSPIAPNKPLTTVMAANIGLLLGILLMLGIERTRKAVRGADDIDRPIVGRIGRPRGLLSASRSAPGFDAAASEAFRGTAVDLLVDLPADAAPPAVLVSGTDGRDTSADAAANLAFAFGRAPMAVALIDVDPDEGRLAERVGEPDVPPPPFERTVEIDERTVLRKLGRLASPSGASIESYEVERRANPLTADSVSRILEALADKVDVVVLYAPPAHGSLDALACAPNAAQSVLVVTRHVASVDEMNQCIDSLERYGADEVVVLLDDRGGRRPLRRLLARRRRKDEVQIPTRGTWALPPHWGTNDRPGRRNGAAKGSAGGRQGGVATVGRRSAGLRLDGEVMVLHDDGTVSEEVRPTTLRSAKERRSLPWQSR